jgi:hypothetical protein
MGDAEPLVINISIAGGYEPPRVQSARSLARSGYECVCDSQAGIGDGTRCRCDARAGTGGSSV